MPNALLPDLRASKSVRWEPINKEDQTIVDLSIYDWEPEYAPHAEVLKTVRVMIRRNSSYADKTNEFLEEIRNRYPNKGQRYFRKSELYKSYGESYGVFTNDSKIEVRTETEPIYKKFYVLNFDLIR